MLYSSIVPTRRVSSKMYCSNLKFHLDMKDICCFYREIVIFFKEFVDKEVILCYTQTKVVVSSFSPCRLFGICAHKDSLLKMDIHADARCNSQFSLGTSPWRHNS